MENVNILPDLDPLCEKHGFNVYENILVCNALFWNIYTCSSK